MTEPTISLRDVRERATTRRHRAKWSTEREASTMGKSGYAPRKAQLADWVVEACGDLLALVEAVEAAQRVQATGISAFIGWEPSEEYHAKIDRALDKLDVALARFSDLGTEASS